MEWMDRRERQPTLEIIPLEVLASADKIHPPDPFYVAHNAVHGGGYFIGPSSRDTGRCLKQQTKSLKKHTLSLTRRRRGVKDRGDNALCPVLRANIFLPIPYSISISLENP